MLGLRLDVRVPNTRVRIGLVPSLDSTSNVADSGRAAAKCTVLGPLAVADRTRGEFADELAERGE